MAKQIFIVANETFYDEDRQLFYTYIGIDDKQKTLLATIWGKNESESKARAESIKFFLEKDS